MSDQVERIQAAIGGASLRAGADLPDSLRDDAIAGLTALHAVAPEIARLGKGSLVGASMLELFDDDEDAAMRLVVARTARDPLAALEAANREDLAALDAEAQARSDWLAVASALSGVGERAAMVALSYLLSALGGR